MFALMTRSPHILFSTFAACLVAVNVHAQGFASASGPADGSVNLLDTHARGARYDSDTDYRRRHDTLTGKIMRQIDPAGIVVRNITLARLDVETLVGSRSALRAENILTDFRLAAFPDLVMRVSVAKDEQLTGMMTGNIVFTGTGRNLSANDPSGGGDWQVMMTLRQSRVFAKQAIAVSIQADSTQGMLVIKPVESLVDDVPGEFLGHHLVVYYKLGGNI